MSIRRSYTGAPAKLAPLAGLTETAHLLRSPRNAARLLEALERARAGTEPPQTLDELRQDIGLGEEA